MHSGATVLTSMSAAVTVALQALQSALAISDI
jgi:hypothetical protein